MAIELAEWGWDEQWANMFAPHAASGLTPARVAIEFNHIYRLVTTEGEINAQQAGRIRHRAGGRHELAAVGDWVAVKKTGETATIETILPRRSKFSRKVAGVVTEEQVVAANIDTVFLVMGLDHDYNLRRLERYLLMSYESGATPVIVLSKADRASDVASRVAEVATIATGTAVHAISAKPDGNAVPFGVDIIASYLQPGRTGALLGSSGVGKSTLVNALLGADLLKTNEVRAHDSRGRHTTRHRHLIKLPGKGMLIDTPGMRELQLWVAETTKDVFDDIEAFAAECRFKDCRHREEPRCAVKRAVEEGRLSADRLASYHKLDDEVRALDARKDARAQIQEKKKLKVVGRAIKQMYKERSRE